MGIISVLFCPKGIGDNIHLFVWLFIMEIQIENLFSQKLFALYAVSRENGTVQASAKIHLRNTVQKYIWEVQDYIFLNIF